MANPNNLIRPAIINPNVQQQNQSANPPLVLSSQLEAQIENLVRRICLEEQSGREPIVVDQEIQVGRRDLTELDKIPDIVKCLREFSGNPGEFGSWKKSVERVLKIYEELRGTTKYYGILSVIRNKITGNADIALEAYNTPLNWDCIIKCLTTQYADKRDLGTLEYQLSSMTQGNKTVQDFYKEIYSHLSLMLNKIACMDESETAIQLLTKTYRNKALDAFVRGLRGDLPRLLGMKEPSDLSEALHLCLKLDNQQYRSQYAINNNKTTSIMQRKQVNPHQNQTFYPHLAFYPQMTGYPNLNSIPPHNTYPQNRSGFYPHSKPMNINRHPNFNSGHNQFPQANNFQTPPRPSQQKPPVPMEVDTSLRSRMVNYMNRPSPNNNRFSGVRPPPQSTQMQRPTKFQRVNHIESNEDSSKELESNNLEPQECVEQTDEFSEYCEQYFEHDKSEQEFSDIHFLD